MRRSCIALNWTPAGDCWGVHVRRSGARCEVTASWHSEADRDKSIAERLLDGYRRLGGREGVYTVAGGQGLSCGLVDLEMPALKAEELRSALVFELKRHAPVGPDKLVWGYRIVPSELDDKQRVRLYFLRRSTWEKWVDDVSGIGQVDMLLPAPAALDPLLGDDAVFLGGGDEGGFTYLPLGDGRREIVAGVPEAEGVFGAGPTPLACAELEPGTLADLPPQEQARFASAVVLGMYGITREFLSDVRTGIALPHNLRPRRHRTSRMVALGLLVYSVVMASVGLVRGYQDRNAELASIQAERRRVEAEIDEVAKLIDPDAMEYMKSLGSEMTDAYSERPTLAMALLELTRTVGHDAWCQSLEWREGSLTVQLKEEQEDVELVRSLEFSPVLGDVVQISKAVGPTGDSVRRFQMNARYDIAGEERPAPVPAEEVDIEDEDPGNLPPAQTDDLPRDDAETVRPAQETPEEESPGKGDENTDTDETRRIAPPPPPPPPPGGA